MMQLEGRLIFQFFLSAIKPAVKKSFFRKSAVAFPLSVIGHVPLSGLSPGLFHVFVASRGR